MKIGVLALQGAFIEHIAIIQKFNEAVCTVRLPEQLTDIDGLIIPGGESTTIMKLLDSFNLIEPLKRMALAGLPIWGTCAGMICLADRISDSNLDTLALMDMEVRRNAFGRQIDSFEVELPVPALGKKPFHAIFIRAPIIKRVGKQVEVLAEFNGKPVAARQGNLLATSFHPELTEDIRFHRYFLQIIASSKFSPPRPETLKS